ncbi:MAG: tubulin-like doman-containing protein [Nostoc sp. ChiQUE02]|uniref:tubulin-like doman-containing protein n=1 Tax=Nostoc sp. ChiQUE02 TaxID=3075377 RepID=UPI002AD3706F|nr:tubulin-like doman-containing protein [Nostoc sp. ChiQUE02]MDZ8230340.1 tubulin-like doman-containing protein [Nostoc sp. ChiQUE02]
MRIRRLIVDRYGDLSNLPIVSFIHIDTDKAATQVTGIRTGSTYHGVDLSFKEAEKVSATMSSNEVTMFVEGLERRSEYTRHGPYDHIGRWFPPQLLRNIKAVEEGAKGIRPVGRLAFFHNYQKVKTAIESAERRTRGHDSLLLKAALRVEPGLSIFVVGSLCGGTGSGMFLDIAYSLRQLYSDQSAKMFGYLVISPELYGNAPSMSANTYAALKELNYYSTPGTKFEAFYDLQNLVFIQEQRPPFDYTYLVSSQTAGEYSILVQGKLCNVIAHKIALDFSSELAPAIKGSRDNFLQHMIQCDKHPRPNSQRYLTFGLAAIYFPRDTIVQIALNRVSLELVKFWLNGKGQSPDPVKLIEQFLIQYHWHNDPENKDNFTTKLAESVQENNKSFRNTISTWRNKLERQISECQKRENRNDIRGQLPREFREQFRKVQPGETESTRGIWLTRLLQISPNTTKELKSNIDDYLSQLLTPTDSNFSIKSTRDWLDGLQHELHNYQLNLQEKITDRGGMKILEDLERKWRDIEQTIEDIEQKPGIPLLNNKNTQFQDEAKKSVQEICKIIQHNFDVTVVQESLKIVNNLQKHVQERTTQVAAFNSLVEDLQSFYEKQDRDLRQLNFDEMSGEAIFDGEDIDRCYQNILPEEDLRRQFVLVSSTITEQTGRGQSLASFIDRERTTPDQLHKEIDLKVDKLFASRSINIVNSVIKRFMQNYSLAVRSTRLAQVMQEAEPLLRLNLTDPYFREDPAKSSKLVGFKDTDELEVRQFKTLLTQDIGVEPSVLKATQAEDEILIVNEYAGFPLRLISSLSRMRNPYLREQHSPTSFLHNDYNVSFPDIIPPDARKMEELEDVFYPCLALALLEKNQGNQQLEFQYHDPLRDSYTTASLSPEWSQALEELANRKDMTEALQQLLDDEIAGIERQPELWENNYLVKLRQFVKQVDEFPEDSANYPYKAAVVGTPTSTDTVAKEGIINRFRRKMNERFKNSQIQTRDIGNKKAIVGEIVVDFPIESTDNLAKRRLELERLKQDLADDLMSEEEYDRQKQKIFAKYPI